MLEATSEPHWSNKECDLLISQHDQMKVILETLGGESLEKADAFLSTEQADTKLYL